MKILKTKLKQKYYMSAAAATLGMMGMSNDAFAQIGGAGGPNFSTISGSITNSMADLPGLVSGVSYIMGLLLGALGIMKIKDHVENPTNTPLKDGAVRLAAGGALLTTGYVATTMLNTVGDGAIVEQRGLNRVGAGFPG